MKKLIQTIGLAGLLGINGCFFYYEPDLPEPVPLKTNQVLSINFDINTRRGTGGFIHYLDNDGEIKTKYVSRFKLKKDLSENERPYIIHAKYDFIKTKTIVHVPSNSIPVNFYN